MASLQVYTWRNYSVPGTTSRFLKCLSSLDLSARLLPAACHVLSMTSAAPPPSLIVH